MRLQIHNIACYMNCSIKHIKGFDPGTPGDASKEKHNLYDQYIFYARDCIGGLLVHLQLHE